MGSSSSESNSTPVIVESFESSALPVMYAEGRGYECNAPHTAQVYYGHSNYRRGNRGRGRGKSQYHKFSSQKKQHEKKGGSTFKLNPLDENGEPTECYCCHSVYHYKDECPVYQHQQVTKKAHYSGFQSSGNYDGPL